MAETVEQYINRILSNVDGDPLAILAATKQRLERLVKEASPEKMKRRPSPERWSVAEILAHLADGEVVAAFRIRKILSEPGCAIPAYDQNLWATNLKYTASDPVASVKHFAVLREMNLALLKGLTDEEWGRFGIHSERGKETLRRVAQMYAGHDVNHLKQIEGMLKE